MPSNPWIVPLVACTVTGALAGTALGLSGPLDDPDEAAGRTPVVTEAVAFYQCPDEGPLGDFHGGDRVYATARDASSSWIEVRAPFALDARVWVPGEAVDPDASFADLPIQACGWDGPPADEALTEPPPEPTGPEVSPPEPEPTEPDAPPREGSAPGPTPPGTGPTAPADTNPPAIRAIAAEPADIWELGCINPVSVVRAVVEDDEGVAGVTLSWSVGGATGSRSMHVDGGDYTAELGDFAPRTIDPAGSGAEAVALTIAATDASGNTATARDSAVLVLHLCD